MLRTSVRTTVVSAGLTGLAAMALAAPAQAGPGTHVAGDLVTYSSAVPDGAGAKVHSHETADGRTIVTLHVKGLRPFTDYGAHAHVNPCGAVGGDAGPHYQFDQGSLTHPDFANPRNEIWLDLTTDAAGDGHAKSVVDWQFPSGRRAASVIIHAEHTRTGEHDSGVAGARLACLSVAF